MALALPLVLKEAELLPWPALVESGPSAGPLCRLEEEEAVLSLGDEVEEEEEEKTGGLVFATGVAARLD